MADENATLRRDYKLLDDNLLEAKLTIRYLQSKIDQMKSIKPPSTPESPRTKKVYQDQDDHADNDHCACTSFAVYVLLLPIIPTA